MYQIPSWGLVPETKEKLTVIRNRIDGLMTMSESDAYSVVKYLSTPDDQPVTVMRDFGEYSVMTSGVFQAEGHLFASATTSLAFNGTFDIAEAGLRLYTAHGNEAAFMGTSPSQMLGFVAMIDAQLESAMLHTPNPA
jgi:hypothetical protein